jgi:hypothetical protein
VAERLWRRSGVGRGCPAVARAADRTDANRAFCSLGHPGDDGASYVGTERHDNDRTKRTMDTRSQRKIIHQVVSTVLALAAARLAVWIVDRLMGEEAS